MTAEHPDPAKEEPAAPQAPARPARRGFAPTLREFPEMRALLTETLPGTELTFEPGIEELSARLPVEQVVQACRTAREDPRLQFDYLRCLSGVDYPDGIEVVYHLWSTAQRHKVTFKTRLPKPDPVFPSVTSVWRAADWHERETAEMFGVRFEGHPHLVPLLLEEGLDEHPLLKSEPVLPILESYDD